VDVPELRTERLLLRAWRDDDVEPFAALNADPVTMAHFPAPLDRAETEFMVERIVARWEKDGHGLWAVEVPDAAPFIGFIGVVRQEFPAHFTPCIEVGWRLARAHWGHGYAPEGGRECLRWGFEQQGMVEIVSMTTESNTKSRRVMEKIGLVRDPDDDFDHPGVPTTWPQRRHVLYRIDRRGWELNRRCEQPDASS